MSACYAVLESSLTPLVYDLPAELLFTLSARSTGGSVQHAQDEETSTTTAQAGAKEDGASTSTGCTLCRASFHTVQEQRQHVKSDFHRYNLKLSIKRVPPIDEATFIKQIGDLDESISGSDTSESESEEGASKQGGDVTLSALLKRQAKISHKDPDSIVEADGPVGVAKAPLLWLSSSKLDANVGLGVYRAVLSDAEQQEASLHIVEIIRRKQLAPLHSKPSGRQVQSKTMSSDPHFFLCMIGGGHFAAAVISLVPENRTGPGGVEERHAVVRAHKTFHRYTTRRKQGGSQSANDNAKGNAHSAGSSIRRYNEAALEVDVRNVLAEWKEMIDTAELVFVRATGPTNRRTLFGPYDGQVLRTNDKRLRGYPFSTKRATQGELLRAFQELTRVKVSIIVEQPPEKPQKEPETAKAPKPKVAPPKPSKEEEEALLHTSQLQALIRRSKVPGVLLYLSKNKLDANYQFFPSQEHHHASTPLLAAAAVHSAPLVLALLVKARADPTVKNGDGKTAYDIAGDPRTRDSFRVARHTLGENSFDWSAAHVPSAMSQEEAEARAQDDKVSSEAMEAERRKAAIEHIRKEEELRRVGQIERKAGTGKSLASIEKSGAEKREEENRGLTPEMRMKLERERRARAAEERLRKMQGGR